MDINVVCPTYSMLYKIFIDEKCNDFKIKYPNVIVAMNMLYEPIFKDLDNATRMNIKCNVRDLITGLSNYEEIKQLICNCEEFEDFENNIDQVIDYLQKTVNIIQKKGFPEFEYRTKEMFNEIEEYEKNIDMLKKINNSLNGVNNVVDTITKVVTNVSDSIKGVVTNISKFNNFSKEISNDIKFIKGVDTNCVSNFGNIGVK